ncbi:MAG: endonuclease III [Candidatus Micrarchaeota archaeon]
MLIKNVIELNWLLKKLGEAYPEKTVVLRHDNPFQLLVAVMLSAQCTDARVNLVTNKLFKTYSGPKDFIEASQKEIENEIYSTGFYKNKTKNIRAASKLILEKYSGRVPNTMQDLLTLPGVARKTANIVLSSAFGKTEGIAVDTHVFRLSKRLGLSKAKIPEKTEVDLMQLIPKEKWSSFSLQLIAHGRRVCVARKPKCSECFLQAKCPKIIA